MKIFWIFIFRKIFLTSWQKKLFIRSTSVIWFSCWFPYDPRPCQPLFRSHCKILSGWGWRTLYVCTYVNVFLYGYTKRHIRFFWQINFLKTVLKVYKRLFIVEHLFRIFVHSFSNVVRVLHVTPQNFFCCHLSFSLLLAENVSKR